MGERDSVVTVWHGVYLAMLAILGASSLALSGTLRFDGTLLLATSLVMLGWFVLRVRARSGMSRDDSLALAVRANWRWGLERYLLFQTSILFLLWLAPVKSAIPHHGGYWADAILGSVERAAFGVDPWKILHLLPDGVTPVIDLIYGAWIVLIVLVSLLVAMFASDRLAARYFLAWGMAWLFLGVVVAYILPSAGPIFGPDLGFGFEGLHAELKGTLALEFHDMLWAMQAGQSSGLGGGISAMPSMHCAITFIFAAAAWRTRLREAVILYAAIIWFGSVYLGWHYALDGLVSLVGVALIWRATAVIADARWPVLRSALPDPV
ncbi:phosphatase PAP2 family protein [Sphingomonas koreensis]